MNANESLVPAQNGHLLALAFEGKSVRMIQREGEPWFVIRDVADILGVGNVSDILSRLDEDEKSRVGDIDGTDVNEALHGNMFIVSESGLYEVVFRSTKPEAKRFRRWVRSEVLPQIRKTGGYTAGPVIGKLESVLVELAREHDSRIAKLETQMRPGEDWMGPGAFLRSRGHHWHGGRIAKFSAICASRSALMGFPIGSAAERRHSPGGPHSPRIRTYAPPVLEDVYRTAATGWIRKDAAEKGTQP